MRTILITLIFMVGVMFGQTTNLSRSDGQTSMQNYVIDNLTYGGESALNIAVGNVSGVSCAHIYGHAPIGVQTTTTDIWDLANDTPTQSVWLAPTAARTHAVVSGSANDAAAAGNYSIMRLLVNPNPDVETLNFITEHRFTIQSNGSSFVEHTHGCYHPIEGPAIIKLNGMANADDTDVSGGFDLILVDN